MWCSEESTAEGREDCCGPRCVVRGPAAASSIDRGTGRRAASAARAKFDPPDPTAAPGAAMAP